MNSKWQINRIGLVDFWYYDEEEFYFLDGRMLLRGSNGSGKSVTMQSFIPLLLDGNMRPERLDPFGSRARKMDNYLLEENDRREERTGYLYIEFKRKDSDTYLTVGVGLRARKSKKLDTWYFVISDGRRIRHDFLLYKDLRNKIAFTKQELKNRIGDGGKVLENQKEYMEVVNKLIFGFETMEEYKEMVDLLIQLRTPKLSKDFKPSVINDILSSSLQPLSEEDLRPMTEAIENMDNLKTNLDNLKQSLDAAKKIERVYDKYNQNILFDKSNQFMIHYIKLQNIKQEISALEQKLNEDETKSKEEEQRIIDLKQEEKVLKEEEQSLNASDAKNLKEKELQTTNEIEIQKEGIASKDKHLESKREKRIEVEELHKTKQQEIEQLRIKIEDKLDRMSELIEDLSFDEHEFMVKDIKNEMGVSYSFDVHNMLVQKLSEKIDEGLDALKEEERVRRFYDERLVQLEHIRKERSQKEKEAIQYENLTIETKNELTEKLFLWAKENQELSMPKEILQQISVKIDQFDANSDYADIKELVRAELRKKEEECQMQITRLTHENDKKKEEIEQKTREINEWGNHKDPSPVQTEAVQRNRQVLIEKGIPFYEFYKAVDFQNNMTEEQANYLEEALLSMGVLDALIIAEEYKEKVLTLDKGLCDKYIFSNTKHIENNMMNLLEINSEENDILFYHHISNVLMSIGYMGDGSTSIDENGNYTLGILTGTITKDYKAKYIGVKAREEYRLRMIKELTDELNILEDEFKNIIDQLEGYRHRMDILKIEFENFPQGSDLRAAVKAFFDTQDKTDRLVVELRRQEEQLTKISNELTIVRDKVREIAGIIYLPARLDVFSKAKEDVKLYKAGLTQIQINQTKYCDGMQYVRDLEEQIEGIDIDIDDILYDINRINREMKNLTKTLASIREQLKLTNYEEIKERLDYCVKRLETIPKEKEAAIRNSEGLKNTMKSNMKYREDYFTDLLKLKKKVQILQDGFQKEYELGYLLTEEIETGKSYEIACKISKMYSGNFGNKKKEDFVGDLQEVFHQNRGWLPEYHLTLEHLFDSMEVTEEYDDINLRRLDILAKYRGVSVKFKELLEKLQKDIEEQTNLLNDQDRELFEDILTNTISKKIRAKIYSSNAWVDKMNQLMGAMKTSSGLTLSLRWKSKTAEHEEQMDTKELVELLKKDADIMKEEEFTKLSLHFRSKIKEARNILEQNDSSVSFHGVMREILDYRKWFEFQLECRKSGENKKELTDRVFFTFSGGEKAMSMYVPLFSAVVAKYQGARPDAPRLISLDEAFAGVDETNINDMFRLMVEFDFEFIINSQILWGDYETVPSIAIYQLLRPENAKFVSVISYAWNGKIREMVEKMGEYIEQ